MATSPQIRTALYRFFAEDERLLYVGVTENVTVRWGSHATNKPWWSEVARKDVEWFDTRALALAAETRAIVAEGPAYNIVHAPGRVIRRRILSKREAAANPPALPLYEFVLEELVRRGQTKAWLKRASNVSRAAIDNWRWQPRTPQAATVLAIANALEIDHQEALRLAGLLAKTEALQLGLGTGKGSTLIDLSEVSTDDLLAEVRRRLLS